MNTTFLLVRHATCERMSDRLNGRTAEARLTETGVLEAADLARRLARFPGLIVFSSPRQRALQTAEAIARSQRTEVCVEPGLDELDFGEWSGLEFERLQHEPTWRAWNEDRANTRPPGGETMREAQHRIVAVMRSLDRRHPTRTLALVTHADVIRAALLYVYALPLNEYANIPIDPASVSKVRTSAEGVRVLSVNEPAQVAA